VSRLQTQGRVNVVAQVHSQSADRIPLVQGRSVSLKIIIIIIIIIKLRPSTDWMRPNHRIRGDLLYSESIDISVNHLHQYFY
jgi:hypothetical protein